MHVFYAPQHDEQTAVLSAEESHHAVKVLRLRTGAEVLVADGKGQMFRSTLMNENPKACEVAFLEATEVFPKHHYHLHVACAPTKNIERFEWFLEKACEIGIDEITPLLCDHSERDRLSVDRLERVLLSAMKQSQKAFLPILHPFTPLRDFCMAHPVGFMAYCEGEQREELGACLQASSDLKSEVLRILIGPEGDFSPAEVLFAQQQQYLPVSLGQSRLRTETAALMAVATVQICRNLKAFGVHS